MGLLVGGPALAVAAADGMLSVTFVDSWTVHVRHYVGHHVRRHVWCGGGLLAMVGSAAIRDFRPIARM